MRDTEIIVRKFQEADYDRVKYIWAATDLDRPERDDNLDKIRRSIELGGVLFLVELAQTSELIGTSWLTFDGRRLHMHHFGILPEYQRRGYAQVLLDHSLNFAGEMKIQIKLEVHRTNLPAINLYKKFGFAYLGDYDIYIIRKV